jgi:anti-sigma regulatory factor (Ser/Thr protein kinase)
MPTAVGSAGWVGVGDHVVEFYERDPALAESVADYLAGPLRDGGVAVVIATEPHRRAFARQLAAVGAGPSAVGGQAVAWLDAADLLSTLMPAGRIDGEEFHREVGTIIAKASAAGRPVRIYGEMVQLLWDAGQVVAALELERLWNEVIGEHRCSLMCAYRSSSVSGAEHSEALQRVCELHSSVFHGPVSAEFLPHPTAPREARRFVTDTLRRSGHTTALVDYAQLAVSELATNAVIHARTQFVVAVQSSHRGVRLSVRDASPHRPVIRDRAANPSGGRGLQVVAALAADWGVEATAQGKTVWAQLQPNVPPAHLRRATPSFRCTPPANAPVPARSSQLSVRSGQSNRSELYRQVADTLEHSADLAERHAEHERRKGRKFGAGIELQRAKRAREAAQRARDLASRLH